MTVDESLHIRRVERDDLLRRAIETLREDPRVVAAWLGGSLGCARADDLSDIDLWVVVRDEDAATIRRNRRDLVTALGTPILIQEAPPRAAFVPQGGAYLLVLYDGEVGPHQVDWYWQPLSPASVPEDVRVLFDSVNLPRKVPRSQSREELRELASDQMISFWCMCNIAAKKVARNQPWAAVSMIRDVERHLGSVRWLVGAGGEPRYWHEPPFLPPASERVQLARLKEMAGEMVSLIPGLEHMGVDVPDAAFAPIYRFIDLCEQMVDGQIDSGMQTDRHSDR